MAPDLGCFDMRLLQAGSATTYLQGRTMRSYWPRFGPCRPILAFLAAFPPDEVEPRATLRSLSLVHSSSAPHRMHNHAPVSCRFRMSALHHRIGAFSFDTTRKLSSSVCWPHRSPWPPPHCGLQMAATADCGLNPDREDPRKTCRSESLKNQKTLWKLSWFPQVFGLQPGIAVGQKEAGEMLLQRRREGESWDIETIHRLGLW